MILFFPCWWKQIVTGSLPSRKAWRVSNVTRIKWPPTFWDSETCIYSHILCDFWPKLAQTIMIFTSKWWFGIPLVHKSLKNRISGKAPPWHENAKSVTEVPHLEYYPSAFPVKHQSHTVINLTNSTSLPISHFLIQMTNARFLKNRIQIFLVFINHSDSTVNGCLSRIWVFSILSAAGLVSVSLYFSYNFENARTCIFQIHIYLYRQKVPDIIQTNWYRIYS